MGWDLQQRIIMVTGASDGLGRALATALGAEGVSVVALSRSEEGLAATQREVESAGGRCLCLPFDLTDFAAYDQLFLALKDHIPHLDGLVHCAAAIDRCTPLQYVKVEVLRSAIDLHLLAPTLLTKSMYPLLKRAKAASTVFVGCSMSGVDQPNWHGYGLAKRALPYAAAMWQLEQEGMPMRFNTLDPGRMRTTTFRRAYPGIVIDTVPPADDAVPALLALLADCSRELRGEMLSLDDMAPYIEQVTG
ncbi:MAG: SDR family NAD(P)-dependent oxidoreductase [Mariprofundales bacterium]|nr:SDR family NAD(P)-dependent oxidoreductase [Mariprofundales bacterium]